MNCSIMRNSARRGVKERIYSKARKYVDSCLANKTFTPAGEVSNLVHRQCPSNCGLHYKRSEL